MSDDERILDLLGRALRDDTEIAPPPERTAALRAQVLARRASAAPRQPAVPGRRRWRRAAAVAAAAAAFVVGLVIGHDPPRPIRELAHDVGLPVDSPTLVDARDQLDRLGSALAAEDEDEVKAADACMLAHVAELDAEEKAEIVPVAHEVHLRAEQFLTSRDNELAEPGCG